MGWLPCIGVVSVCCCKEVYRYPHNNTLLIFPTPLVLALFLAAASLLLSSFFECFFGLVSVNIFTIYRTLLKEHSRSFKKIEITRI